jgi:hypothetical protein
MWRGYYHAVPTALLRSWSCGDVCAEIIHIQRNKNRISSGYTKHTRHNIIFLKNTPTQYTCVLY